MAKEEGSLVEGRDYYLESGLFVLTAEYLCRRGYCCGSGCRHCPYEGAEKKVPEPSSLAKSGVRPEGSAS